MLCTVGCRLTRSSITQYCIHHCRKWGRVSVRVWTHKVHPYCALTVELWAVFVNILEKFARVITAPHYIKSNFGQMIQADIVPCCTASVTLNGSCCLSWLVTDVSKQNWWISDRFSLMPQRVPTAGFCQICFGVTNGDDGRWVGKAIGVQHYKEIHFSTSEVIFVENLWQFKSCHAINRYHSKLPIVSKTVFQLNSLQCASWWLLAKRRQVLEYLQVRW